MEFKLSDDRLPMDYHSCLMSFIKKAFESASISFYERLFATGKPTYKPYTFSVWFPNAQFGSGKVVIPARVFNLTFSTHDTETAIYAANGFAQLLYTSFGLPDANAMQLTNLAVVREVPVRAQRMVIRFMSPLLVRDHETQNDRRYLLPDNPGFMRCLRRTVGYQLEKAAVASPSLSERLDLTAIRHRKTVVRYYGQTIDASIGRFLLSGPCELLQHLYKCGVGSRRGAGFGMFDIVQQEGD